LDTLKHFRHLVLVLLAIWALGCSEDIIVPPPPSPPTIGLQTISGMPSDDVFDVFVDSQDRLWVSTNAGVVMFESTQGPFDVDKATLFSDRDGIPNRTCRGMTELNGKIFVGTWGGGVGVYDDTTPWKAIKPSDGLVDGRVFDVAADDTSIWVATVKGVGQYIDDETRPMADRFADYDSIFGGGVFSSILVHNSTTRGAEVWVTEKVRDVIGIIVPGGIKVLRLPGLQLQYMNTETSGIPSDDVSQISYDATRDVFWSAHPTSGVGSLDVDPRIWNNLTTGDGLVSNLANSVAINHLGMKWTPGTVWIATQAGLTKIHPDGRKVNYTDGSGLPNVRVRKVYVDDNDDVWLAFVDRGAAKVVAPKK